jgi:hypothetical protein
MFRPPDFFLHLNTHALSVWFTDNKGKDVAEVAKRFIKGALSRDFCYDRYNGFLQTRRGLAVLYIVSTMMSDENRKLILAARPELRPVFLNHHISSLVRLVAPHDAADRTNGPMVRQLIMRPLVY